MFSRAKEFYPAHFSPSELDAGLGSGQVNLQKKQRLMQEERRHVT